MPVGSCAEAKPPLWEPDGLRGEGDLRPLQSERPGRGMFRGSPARADRLFTGFR
jgi:hypothetical protein